MKYLFFQIDVFSKVPFGGNPLAVIIDGEGLSTMTMQNIAKEMNLSETTFVFPADQLLADFSIRIFTPEKELPFAGHPVLGTAHILRENKKNISGNHNIKLSTRSGIVEITQRKNENYLSMSQKLPEFQLPIYYTKEVSEVLGIPKTAISTSYPIQIISSFFV